MGLLAQTPGPVLQPSDFAVSHSPIRTPFSVLSCFSYVQLCNSMECSPPGSSVHGISQARTLEWVAISFFRGPSQPKAENRIPLVTLQVYGFSVASRGRMVQQCPSARNSTGGLHHNSRRAHWTSHIERSPSAANRDEKESAQGCIPKRLLGRPD